ncbi:MAG TPA: hypothetical protein VMV99_13585 [Rhodanobacter sp.]|nr:hypothetical protein [Rhodanobacter sp.]
MGKVITLQVASDTQLPREINPIFRPVLQLSQMAPHHFLPYDCLRTAKTDYSICSGNSKSLNLTT